MAGTDIAVSPDRRQISVKLQQDVRLTLLSWVEGRRPLWSWRRQRAGLRARCQEVGAREESNEVDGHGQRLVAERPTRLVLGGRLS